jgi:hypothetical protein
LLADDYVLSQSTLEQVFLKQIRPNANDTRNQKDQEAISICPVDTFKGYICPCSFPSLIAADDGIPVELSITPSFHYSYQCSFSLISSLEAI